MCGSVRGAGVVVGVDPGVVVHRTNGCRGIAIGIDGTDQGRVWVSQQQVRRFDFPGNIGDEIDAGNA